MHADAHMNSVTHRSRARRATGAFTLVEIVLVVAILATLAGLALSSLGGAEAQATANVAIQEMSQVRQAVLRFREDTGYLPKQGMFDLTSRGGRVRIEDFPGPESHVDPVQWFDAPENLWQLFDCPLDEDSDPMAKPAHGRRGWRGPYLSKNAEARFRFAEGLPPVPAVVGPFVHATEVKWVNWTTTESADALARHRPLRLLDLDDADEARIISPGPDGSFDLANDETPDDLVLYLLR